MAESKQARVRRTFAIGNRHVVLGPRLWIALLGAIAIIVIGFSTNPTDPLAGALIALSSVLGIFVGIAFQLQPTVEDNSPRAMGAIRSLASIADSAGDTAVIIDQVLENSREPRTQAALISVRMDLNHTVRELYVSMTEWDGISPGALEFVISDRDKGRATLRRLSQKEQL